MNVVLRLMEAAVKFVWWWGGVCTGIFMSNPTTVLRLCCRWAWGDKSTSLTLLKAYNMNQENPATEVNIFA